MWQIAKFGLNYKIMLKSTIKIEDETGQVMEKTVTYSEKSLHLGTFSAIETLMEDIKQSTFPEIEGQLLLFQQDLYEKKAETNLLDTPNGENGK
jgi:hypothetical protein